ncbi:MAG TPA: alkaline phosphatase family protein [Allosphingosinicella sp.]|nr:alkaline phosphatase family protein [Allosphingosinicella sp.]
MDVRTIFILMMENRSFDHLLGYLSLTGHPVEGLRNDPGWRDSVANSFNGNAYRPFPLTDPYGTMEADPPHNRSSTKTQLGRGGAGEFPMSGFVETYSKAKGAAAIGPSSKPAPMGYFTGAEAPITDFLARNFAVCDHWHAALPAGTQPNRLMAMSGFTRIDANTIPCPRQELVYDWLRRNGIRWRVYHAGIPFFSMMIERVDDILLGGHFRPFEQLFDDVQNEPPDEFPQVVFLEPVYADAPHFGASCDDHAPGGIKGGQEFLLEVYRSLTRVPDVWKGSVLIVTYDEHGGFFDHVPPPPIPTEPPPGALFTERFTSLGVRVPALVVSPFVRKGSVCSETMDHVSILKFIGDTFGPGRKYSAAVDARPVSSVSAVLDNPAGGRRSPVVPTLNAYLARQPKPAGRLPGKKPDSDIQLGFQKALDEIRKRPARRRRAYDPLLASFPPDPGSER